MTVTYERRGRVAIVSIVRPEVRNAIDRTTARALAAAWRRFDVDPEVDIGVLHGAGGNFSAGADLKAMDLEDTAEGPLGFTRTEVRKPTIAAIEGYCVAGGLEMALWCDLRVAGASAAFGCFERRFGVPLMDGGTQRLPRIVGQGLAMELLLTGRRVEAEEAHAIGLVNTVVSDGDALAYAVMLAERIASAPQETVRSDRLALIEGLGRPLADGLEIERQYGLRVSDLAAAGAARFAEGAGRSGAPVAPWHHEQAEEPPEVIDVSDEDLEVIEDTAAMRFHMPTSGVGRGALVVEGPGSTELIDRLVGLGFVVESVVLSDDVLLPEPSLASIQEGIESLLHSGVVIGEKVALVATGEAAALAMWASTLDTRIGAVVAFGLAPWKPDVQPAYRLADAAYMGHQGVLGEEPDVAASELEEALRDLGMDATFHTYRKAAPGFFNPDSEAHDANMSDLAWKRTRLFLNRSL